MAAVAQVVAGEVLKKVAEEVVVKDALHYVPKILVQEVMEHGGKALIMEAGEVGSKTFAKQFLESGGKAVVKEVVEVGGKAVVKEVVEVGGKAVVKEVVEVGGKAVAKESAQVGGKAASGAVPIVGAVVSLSCMAGSIAWRWSHAGSSSPANLTHNICCTTGEVVSGLLGCVPVVGTGMSIACDVAIGAADVTHAVMAITAPAADLASTPPPPAIQIDPELLPTIQIDPELLQEVDLFWEDFNEEARRFMGAIKESASGQKKWSMSAKTERSVTKPFVKTVTHTFKWKKQQVGGSGGGQPPKANKEKVKSKRFPLRYRAHLRVNGSTRYTTQWYNNVADVYGAITTYDRGHMLPRREGGGGNIDNLFWQSRAQNRGAYKVHEKNMANIIADDNQVTQGAMVHWVLELQFGESKTTWLVEYFAGWFW